MGLSKPFPEINHRRGIGLTTRPAWHRAGSRPCEGSQGFGAPRHSLGLLPWHSLGLRAPALAQAEPG